MAKYEETLLIEYKNLLNNKKDLLARIDSAAWRLFQVKGIDKELKETDYILIKFICLTKKIRQLIRCETKAKKRFSLLADEYWPLDKRIKDIEDTLIKYYDKQIEDCVHDLGIENVSNIKDLLAQYHGKLLDKFEGDDAPDSESV